MFFDPKLKKLDNNPVKVERDYRGRNPYLCNYSFFLINIVIVNS